MRRRAAFVLAAALLASAGLSTAGIRERALEVGGYGGIQTGDNNANVSSDATYGLRIAYALSPKLMIEATVDAFDTEREIVGLAGDPSQPAAQIRFTEPSGTEFLSYSIGLTANFLTERDVKTTPYLSVGLGAVTEKRDAALFCVDLQGSRRNPAPTNPTCAEVRPNGELVDPNSTVDPNGVVWVRSLEDDDTGTLLMLAAGARTFFMPWLGVRYEVRYNHHDSFGLNQDAFEMNVGATFVFGGKK